MLIFFFKINVNFPQLLYFVVLAVTIYSCKDDKIRQLGKVYVYFEEKYQHYPQYFAFNTNFVIFPYKSFKFRVEQIVCALWYVRKETGR